jgi:hypothetical protein
MAQNRRKPKETGFDRITLMIPTDLKAKLDAEVKPGARTFSDVARECLRLGLEADVPVSGLSQRARTIGWLMGHLASDLVTYSSPDDTAAMLKIGAVKLIDRLGGNTKLKPEVAEQAAQFADFLWLKMSNADQLTASEGVPVSQTNEQRKLLETRAAWAPTASQTSRKDAK